MSATKRLAALLVVLVAPLFMGQNYNIPFNPRGGAYNCATDPQSHSWAHLYGVTNFENATADPMTVSDGSYTVGTGEYLAGADQSWSILGDTEVSSSDAHTGSYGAGSNNTSSLDRLELTVSSFDEIAAEEGRVGYWLQIFDGTSGCTSGDDVGFIARVNAGTYTLWHTIVGTEASGWDLKASFNDGSVTRSATATDVVAENTWYFVEIGYNSDTTGYDTGSDYVKLYINGSLVATDTNAHVSMNSSTNRIMLTEGFSGTQCQARVDDIWVSSDPSFDIYTYVVTHGCNTSPI